MCYIFNCFGWILDLIQRIITFFLACWLAYAVCIGLAVAAVAGLAYGYNYSLAEFLTYTRADVTVYMKRGQFYDRPDVIHHPGYRRSGQENIEEEELPSNAAIDYEEHKRHSIENQAAPLSDSWKKAQDTRKYAERLVKYEYSPSREHKVFIEGVQAGPFLDQYMKISPKLLPTVPPEYYKLTTSPLQITKLISIAPNVIISTALYQSGSSQIVMRNFQPIEEVVPSRTPPSLEEYGNKNYDNQFGRKDMVEEPSNLSTLPKSQYILRGSPVLTTPMETKDPLEVLRKSHQKPQKLIPMRHWAPGSTSIFKNFPDEETYGEVSHKPD